MKRTTQDSSEPNRFGIFSGTAAFIRIALKLGVLDRKRKEFWRYLAHILVENRHRLVEGLRLAAMGYHFRKLNDDMANVNQGT